MKYYSQRRRVATNPNKHPCSPTWTTMKRGMDTFIKGSRWMVGRDSRLNIWHNNWMNGGPLR